MSKGIEVQKILAERGISFEDFSQKQKKEIKKGLNSPLSVEQIVSYAKPQLDPKTMHLMKEMYQYGVPDIAIGMKAVLSYSFEKEKEAIYEIYGDHGDDAELCISQLLEEDYFRLLDEEIFVPENLDESMYNKIEKRWSDHYHNWFETDFKSVDNFLDTQIKEYERSEALEAQIQECEEDVDLDPER